MVTNPVVLSVVIMIVLCLLKLNVILSLIIAALAGGLLAGMSPEDIMGVLVGGMGGNSNTALSYILLGAMAAALHHTYIKVSACSVKKSSYAPNTRIGKLLCRIGDLLKRFGAWVCSVVTVIPLAIKTALFCLFIAAISSLSQNAIPVHISFIPILIPPMLKMMNRMGIDRRRVAAALTFGLKAPYVALPVGYGLIFHGLISDNMAESGMNVAVGDIWRVMWVPGVAMVLGLVLAILYYRKPRDYKEIDIAAKDEVATTVEASSKQEITLLRKWIVMIGAVLGAVAALVIQIQVDSLPLGAVVGIGIILAFNSIGGTVKWKDLDGFMHTGIGMMGFIAFVMLVASGYASVIRETGGVETLVDSASGIMGGSKLIASTIMILVGLVITMGIGTSFGTIPIIAAIYVPLAATMGFSPMATVLLIGTAAALGDAGSPASDSTLGPTAGLNADGQHDHIRDTCIPTFLFYNIPLVIFAIVGSMIF